MTAPLGMTADDLLPPELGALYEVRNYRNASQVLATACKSEFGELVSALLSFRLTLADIRKPGGSESDIPKKFSALLRPHGWKETRIKGDLIITKLTGAAARSAAADEDDDE